MKRKKHRKHREPMLDVDRRFIATLDALSETRYRRDVFCDLMEAGYCAIAKTTWPAGPHADALEARYASVVANHDKAALSDLFAVAIEGIAAGGDFLGRVCTQLEILNDGLGQFFTPYYMSSMLAEMVLGSATQAIERQGYVTLLEPACGAGSMVLAAAEAMQRKGFDPATQLLATAIDLDPLCFKMTYVQLALRGVPADVINGNALSEEWFEIAATPAKVAFCLHHRAHFEALQADGKLQAFGDAVREPDGTIRIEPETTPAQYDLFGDAA